MKNDKSSGGLLQLIKFGIVGAVSTVIDMGLLNLLVYLGLPYWASLAIGFAGGTVNGYYMNSRWTFGYNTEGREGVKFGQFAIISGVGLFLTELIGNYYVANYDASLHILGYEIGPQNVGKLIAVVLVFAWNYLGNRFWTFRSEKK